MQKTLHIGTRVHRSSGGPIMVVVDIEVMKGDPMVLCAWKQKDRRGVEREFEHWFYPEVLTVILSPSK